MKVDVISIVEEIVRQSLIEIEFLINNSDNINKLSEGLVNLSKITDFRSGITIVYMAEQNKGILSKVGLDFIYKLIDEGVIDETAIDSIVYVMALNGRNKITQSQLSKQNFSMDCEY